MLGSNSYKSDNHLMLRWFGGGAACGSPLDSKVSKAGRHHEENTVEITRRGTNAQTRGNIDDADQEKDTIPPC